MLTAITRRTVWGLIGDLKRATLVDSRRDGRNYYYTINGEGRFPDPLISHLTLDDALRAIAPAGDRRDPSPAAVKRSDLEHAH